ncbi:hypothetical protein [Pseudoalteromonas denitrificans]|nr:hypothetical protein [Pseudoalteromonas denitrificans]
MEVNSRVEQIRSRLFYQGNRNGPFNGHQVSHRKLNPVVVLKFSGTF